MKFTYYGHSCFAVETKGKTLLFDPYITPNPFASEIKLGDLKADYILISHGHGDHIADAVELAKLTGAAAIANFEVAGWLARNGVQKTVGMNHGGAAPFDFGRLKYVNAIHSSSLPDGSYGGNPGGFVVSNTEGAFYYAGDTALTLDMKLIAEEYRLDFAVLPIGDYFTMGISDAIRAARFIDCKTIVGAHYDTFPPIRIDRVQAQKQFQEAGLDLFLPPIGGSIDL